MRNVQYIFSFLLLACSLASRAQQPFRAGNIVVYRVGDGTVTLTTGAAPVFLDEYTTDGALVQSIPMPTTASGNNKILTARGLGGGRTEGMMNLSTNGKYLVVPGINAAPGATVSSGAVMGLVDFNGTINTSTSVTDFTENSNTPYSAISDDGSRFWFGAFGGIRYTTTGSSSSVLVTNAGTMHDYSITDGQLYASSTLTPGGIYKVGTGLPVTTGQTVSRLPGLPLAITPFHFEFADLDPAIPGADVLYIADQGTPGGITKYSLVAGSWVVNGNVGTGANNYTNLTIRVLNSEVTIFATRMGSNSNGVRGGELVKLVDNSGYNGTIAGTPVVLAAVSVPNTMAFRGVALVPQPAPFKPGNIVVYRVGNATTALTTAAAPVFLDEYTVSGTLVQSIAMPTAVSGTNKVLTARGLGGGRTEGMINLSADGKSLIVPGLNAALGATVSPGAVMGVVDFNAKINTSTVITDFTENSNSPYAAISDDGTRFWFGGFGAVRYTTLGSSSSTLISNAGTMHDYSIADGQLYVSSTLSPGGIYKVGTGLPTATGQTVSRLPGLPLSLNPLQFELADLDAGVPGADVLYIADQGTPGGILKFSLVNGGWVDNGNVGVAANNYSNLAIRVSSNEVTIFAVRMGANSNGVRGGELVKLVDNSGYNGMLTGTPTVLASIATANTAAFRGVSRVPTGCPAVTGLRVPDISASAANVVWTAPGSGGGGNYEYAISTSPVPPASGTMTTNTAVSFSSLVNATTYYVHVRTVCSAVSKSEWMSQSFTTGCKPPPVPLVAVQIAADGTGKARWNKVFGAAGYEYYISTSTVSPASGTPVSDTSFILPSLSASSSYYLHVRSHCGAGVFSPWAVKPFTTGCFVPTLSLTALDDRAGVRWNRIPNATRYEYALTYSPANPLGGTTTTDTVYTTRELEKATAYYFHVRSTCIDGSLSAWSTIQFDTHGMLAYPNPVADVLKLRWSGVANPAGDITVVDAMGRTIARAKATAPVTTLSTAGWLPGVYFIHYRDPQHRYTRKVLKL